MQTEANTDLETGADQAALSQAHADASAEKAAQARELDEDGLPVTFTMEDLLGLPEDEAKAIIADQEADIAAAEAAKAPPEPTAEELAAAEERNAQQQAESETAKARAIEAQNEAVKSAQAAIDKAAAEVSTHEAAKKELLENYRAGDIDDDTFMEQLNGIDESLIAAKVMQQTAQQTVAQSQQSRADQWYAQVNEFHAKHEYLTTEEHLNGWDAELRSVNQSFPNMTDAERIELAYTRYSATQQALGKPLQATTGDQGESRKPAEVTTDPRPDAPQTLARVPQSDVQSPRTDGRFGAIDQLVDTTRDALDVYDAEAAVSTMSDKEMDAWLRDG